MDNTKLKKFAQFARRSLIEQVSNKLKLVLAKESEARRENAEAVRQLEKQIADTGETQVVEKVAYIWFNRFCALRFMDVNRYTRIGVVSPSEGQFQPEILAEAKMGHIDEEMVPEKTRQQIFALLDGKAPSRDPQGEVYRLLVVAACNHWNKAMPFLFQRIDDYTELLMPDDLLSGNSILASTREAMTPDACEDVEVIGWLYQFYISEKKDEVFDGLKKNKKITPENIPAATQLFTPHWIVRYLVENSLGRLWLLNHPGSKLVLQMDYYIKPEQAEMDFLRIAKPEEIKICDPACGSGHMLTYAFDLLYAIYEEEGYESAEIPEKILTHNLYGIEIDERAGELAAFALTMKARSKQRRFFNKGIKPNICVLENVRFDEGELKNYMDFVGRDLFTFQLQTTLRQFEEADNFGSLIRPDVTDVDGMLRILESKNVSGHLFLSMTHQKVLRALWQADCLSPKYHVVIANPPYAGGKGLNQKLGSYLKEMFPAGKSDLMTAFMERMPSLCLECGYWGMINLQSWMFIGSYEQLRINLIAQQTVSSFLHLGRGIFGSDFGSVAFVVQFNKPKGYSKAVYRRLFERHVQVRTPGQIEALFHDPEYNHFSVPQSAIAAIPGSPISYWISEPAIEAFAGGKTVGQAFKARQGLATADDERFLRSWYEVSIENSTQFGGEKWVPFLKGGDFRKWYGNQHHVVNWEDDGKEIKNFIDDKGKVRSRPQNTQFYGRSGISWSIVSSGAPSFRKFNEGFIIGHVGPGIFADSASEETGLICALNSNVSTYFLGIISETFKYEVGHVNRLPLPFVPLNSGKGERLVNLAKTDWDAYEGSWDFTSLPLLNPDYRQPTLKSTYQKLRSHWREMTLEMQQLEEENNRIFIEAYGLQDELTPEVPLNEITLTCNPHYRYGGGKSEDELEALLLADTVRELASYAVGCMFGRYALDKPGLILANQGETIEDYLKRVPEPSFSADDDNVIPLLDGDWFTDDIAERFRKFLRVAFGEEHYEPNLKFIEKALGKDIRKYFLKDFYNDHVKRYKKRPIYWLFFSPKGSFNALIYMHRYRPDTASVVLNGYLREFRTKLTSRRENLEQISISTSASPGEKTKAIKEIEQLKKMIAELEDYERDVLYPLATKQLAIDLDDGVKVNYPKLGAALKKIPGLEAKEDE
jgi:SAM-dependent methyltransferase